ncbi:hypothetical protein D046_1909B, partial [Vibrio parahaemolyticus V-223/04]
CWKLHSRLVEKLSNQNGNSNGAMKKSKLITLLQVWRRYKDYSRIYLPI